jgi:hypothetical protein
VGVISSQLDKRVAGEWIIKRKDLFEVRPGQSKSAGKHQVSAGGVVTQNEPSGIVPLTAQMQQILSERLRQIHFTAGHVIA